MKKIIIILIVSALIAISLVGCKTGGLSEPDEPQRTRENEESEEITMSGEEEPPREFPKFREPEHEIIGTWISEDNTNFITFRSDGTMTNGKYEIISSNQITLMMVGSNLTSTFNIIDDTLTLTSGFTSVVYHRATKAPTSESLYHDILKYGDNEELTLNIFISDDIKMSFLFYGFETHDTDLTFAMMFYINIIMNDTYDIDDFFMSAIIGDIFFMRGISVPDEYIEFLLSGKIDDIIDEHKELFKNLIVALTVAVEQKIDLQYRLIVEEEE
jgi:hypothetical protein